MKKFAILLAAMFFAVACGNNTGAKAATDEAGNQDQVEMLKKEVMEVHDKTMSKMGMLTGLDKDLRAAIDVKEDTAAYVNALNDVRSAHNDMMEWMRNFENPDEMDASTEEKVKYLSEQLDKVKQLDQYTDSSIDRAKRLLAEG